MILIYKILRGLCLLVVVFTFSYVFRDISEEYESRHRILSAEIAAGQMVALPTGWEMVKYTAYSVIIFTAMPILCTVGFHILLVRKRKEEEEARDRRRLKTAARTAITQGSVSIWRKYPPPVPQEPIRQGAVDQHLFRIGS